MATTQRFSISVDKDRATQIRELVASGAFPTVSSAFDAAADALIERERAKAVWWEETLRRCQEAECDPAQLVEPDAFFRRVRQEIANLNTTAAK